jgi:dTDP-4-amino-4,6-dideoxygalactose transaminase
MWGYPTPAKDLFAFANAKGLILIRDAAQAHGTKADGITVAKNCHIACFSTHDRKIIATGEGGFVLTDNDVLAQRMKSYIQFGYLSGDDLGLNFKLNAVTAALGISGLAGIDKQLSSRQKNASFIISRLRTDGLVREFSILPGGQPNYYTLLLVIATEAENVALSFIRYLNEQGIPSDITRYKCQPVFDFPRLKNLARPCPNATSILRRITTIPVHPGITETNLHRIVSAINSYRGH